MNASVGCYGVSIVQVDEGDGQQSDFQEAIPDNDDFRISDILTTVKWVLNTL